MKPSAGVPGWIAARSGPQRLLLALLAGGVGGLGQAPFDAPVSAVLGLAFLSGLVLLAQTWRQGFWLGLIGGAGYFAVSLNWIVEPFFVDPLRHGWMAPFALVLMSVGLALFWALPAALAVRIGAGWPDRALIWAALWALGEYARANLLTGFPWAHPGHVWIDTGLLPLASVIGPHGFTLYTVLAAALLALCALNRSLWALAIPATHLALIGLAGVIPAAPPAGPDAPVVRIVQPNAPQHLKWREDMVEVFFDRAVELTASPPQIEAGPPDLVVWPETTLPVLLEYSTPWRERIAAASGPAPVILGAQRFEGDHPRNSLVVLDGDGAVTALYDKHHLVPFGEYMPFSALADALGIEALAAVLQGGYRPGSGPATLALGPLGTAFPMICYEAIFPGYIGQVPRPDWIVHITNDAWFGQFSGPYQHLALTRLRAAEQGLPVVRAANTGVSAVIDARGQIVAGLALDEAGALDALLPPALPPTTYARNGDWPVFFVLLATFGAGAVLRRVKPIES